MNNRSRIKSNTGDRRLLISTGWRKKRESGKRGKGGKTGIICIQGQGWDKGPESYKPSTRNPNIIERSLDKALRLAQTYFPHLPLCIQAVFSFILLKKRRFTIAGWLPIRYCLYLIEASCANEKARGWLHPLVVAYLGPTPYSAQASLIYACIIATIT